MAARAGAWYKRMKWDEMNNIWPSTWLMKVKLWYQINSIFHIISDTADIYSKTNKCRMGILKNDPIQVKSKLETSIHEVIATLLDLFRQTLIVRLKVLWSKIFLFILYYAIKSLYHYLFYIFHIIISLVCNDPIRSQIVNKNSIFYYSLLC